MKIVSFNNNINYSNMDQGSNRRKRSGLGRKAHVPAKKQKQVLHMFKFVSGREVVIGAEALAAGQALFDSLKDDQPIIKPDPPGFKKTRRVRVSGHALSKAAKLLSDEMGNDTSGASVNPTLTNEEMKEVADCSEALLNDDEWDD